MYIKIYIYIDIYKDIFFCFIFDLINFDFLDKKENKRYLICFKCYKFRLNKRYS